MYVYSVCERSVYGKWGKKGAGEVLLCSCHSTISLFSIRFSCDCNSDNKLDLDFMLGMYPSPNTLAMFGASTVS